MLNYIAQDLPYRMSEFEKIETVPLLQFKISHPQNFEIVFIIYVELDRQLLILVLVIILSLVWFDLEGLLPPAA